MTPGAIYQNDAVLSQTITMRSRGLWHNPRTCYLPESAEAQGSALWLTEGVLSGRGFLNGRRDKVTILDGDRSRFFTL